jgi:hypothetical protein
MQMLERHREVAGIETRNARLQRVHCGSLGRSRVARKAFD